MNVQWLWLAASLAGVVVTTWLLIDAVMERRDYLRTDGNGRVKARKMVLASTVRRDALRLLAQAALLVAVVPGLLSGSPVVLSLDSAAEVQRSVTVVVLMAAPILLLANSVLDARDRRRLKVASEQIVLSEREKTDAALLAAVEAVGDKADAAYVAANDTNLKIGNLNEQLVEQGTDQHQQKQDTRITDLEGEDE